jgi:hypothetical protein
MTVDVCVNAAIDARFDAIGGTTALTNAHLAIEKIRTELKPHEDYLRGGPLTFRLTPWRRGHMPAVKFTRCGTPLNAASPAQPR